MARADDGGAGSGHERSGDPGTRSTGIPGEDAARATAPHILVVDDNETNRDLIGRQLARLGCRCDPVGSGREALERWRAGRYDMLLTDLQMPDMDGFELAAAIRAEESSGGQRLPIVAISANSYDEQAGRCLASGMDGYLSKPVGMSELRSGLSRWLDGDPSPSGRTTDAPVVAASAASAPAPGSPIDPSALRELVGDDLDAVSEILADFVRHARETADALAASALAGAADDVRGAAHKLKSSARGVGAGALADLCERLERAGEHEDAAGIDAGVAELDALVGAVEAHVSRR